ncbi:MAG: 23S rRNA (adenine(2503)-C(2))-methyltransferase RlmN, partial [Pyrinomonadaceae bacterium]|nr:23S rRNA (adenine(2503)-C(2))-methyltransferase RlmN [Sphingobacteriaceae bacterium]
MDEVVVKKDIRNLSSEEIKKFLSNAGEPVFRAKQISEWLWAKSANSFEQMSNLSKSLRKKLELNFTINTIKIDQTQYSSDRTIKNTFKLYDDNIIEGVLIPTTERITACVSSQVGCSLTCKFCATGYMDRKRNLDAGEIYDQVVLIDKQAKENYGLPLSNIVYMGMGEPLLNYANVLKSIEYLTSEEGLNMASKRITVSTAG